MFDVLATLPSLVALEHPSYYWFKLFRYVHFRRLLSLINHCLSRVFNRLGLNKQVIERIFYFITLLLHLVFIIHILACCWCLIGLHTDGSWVYKRAIDDNDDENGKGDNKPEFEDSNIAAVYIRAIYFIICTLTTVGYGDFKGFTNIEYLF